MISEWMKVMLEEISRKRTEAQQARVEEQQRIEEQQRHEEVDLERRQSNGRRAAE
ncbi:MAG TPA: hypothetical protein VKH13_16440 [Steroidobacteraceae bacterium]|nr:hypothetical protein [Steroidobacteraceae bacterium]